MARFEWPLLNSRGEVTTPAAAPAVSEPPPVVEDAAPTPPAVNLAEVEREAFAKGYEQGERAGADSGKARIEALLARLGNTIDEVAGLRRTMAAQTERQLVQLAIAIATRIVRREVELDPELSLANARLALERLGPARPATIRLHPEDWAIAAEGRAANWAGEGVTVVSDAAVPRGGCHVESDAGFVDASADAQIAELSRAMLEEGVTVAVPARHAA
ncbi:MAG TPA: FliH/SctL family protein [Vicinamibacterales bacterium]|nr:FliH/SctL family protein [Vicinamibacterales bacterium]